MKFRWGWIGALACGLAMAAMSTSAQEMSFRSGTVTGISPIQVAATASTQQAKPARTTGALGRALGNMAGRAASRVGGGYSYDAYQVASSATQDVVEGVGAAPVAGGTVTAYMVLMRFDDGSESAIQAAGLDGLAVGKRARVFGAGAGAQIVAE